MTTTELIAELEAKLEYVKGMREFSFKNWGEESSYKDWEKETSFYTNLLAEIKAYQVVKEMVCSPPSEKEGVLSDSEAGMAIDSINEVSKND